MEAACLAVEEATTPAAVDAAAELLCEVACAVLEGGGMQRARVSSRGHAGQQQRRAAMPRALAQQHGVLATRPRLPPITAHGNAWSGGGWRTAAALQQHGGLGASALD